MNRSRPDDGLVTVGIDAGGTSTHARAVRAGRIVHDRTGGPGNPRSTKLPALRISYATALQGCPPARRVAACVAGASSPRTQRVVADVITALHPTADVTVAPDYVCAFHALPAGTDLCVIAGTGSLVCSRDADGTYRTSGGRGWILGDLGSAARLGQALLSHYVHNDRRLAQLREPLTDLYGTADWRNLIQDMQDADAPAARMAASAPLLTRLAEDGEPWAAKELQRQMEHLAGTAATHLDEHSPDTGAPQVGLVGGVWSSPAAVWSFTAALSRCTPHAVVRTDRVADPIEGAVRLAQELP